MESLLPAFIAVLLAEMGGKTQSLSKVYGEANAGPLALASLSLSSLINYGAAAIAGILLGKQLAYDARSLMFALALLFAGLPMLMGSKAVPPLPTKQNMIASLWRFMRSQFGDGAQFIVFALAARAGSPTLAVLGGLLGVMAACGLPILIAKDWPEGGALRLIKAGCGVLLSVTGFMIAITALKLTSS
jgi:Ca2+/H+ antiporter, TMEM165/GDT1 family